MNYLPGLASNCVPPELSLLNSQDYSSEPQRLACMYVLTQQFPLEEFKQIRQIRLIVTVFTVLVKN
jgi:hypothetical protein